MNKMGLRERIAKILIFNKIILLLFVFIGELQAQVSFRYWVQFTDKNNSPYSLSQPSQFLSSRAIQRRTRQNLPLQINDLPVNPAYVELIADYGVKVLTRSKWLNSVIISMTDTSVLNTIRSLAFVSEVKYVAPGYGKIEYKQRRHDKWEILRNINNPYCGFQNKLTSTQSNSTFYNYGPSANQAEMIRINILHDAGFSGKGIVIAVLDAGFYRLDESPCFAKLRSQNNLLGTKDFVDAGGNVFGEDSHGALVMSTMAGYIEGQIIGTAPEASYWLLRSEDTGSEFPVEEDYWVSAAEYADSVGADIINSSLGYTVFDDNSLSHTQEEMNGNTAHSSIGADIAASKGILVVNSAGNSAGSFWQIIGAPADGDSVLAVGAVDPNGHYAFFSSTGPSSDGQVKPDVVAQGMGTVLYSAFNGIITENGTSFSSPIVAGAAACLWQAHPLATNIQILRAIQKTASQYLQPNALLGYGIPNFEEADRWLYSQPGLSPYAGIKVYPNPSSDNLDISIYLGEYKDVEIYFFDNIGREVMPSVQMEGHPGNNIFHLATDGKLSQGLYFIQCKVADHIYKSKWLKI